MEIAGDLTFIVYIDYLFYSLSFIQYFYDMTSSNNHYHLKSSFHSDDDSDDQTTSTWCHYNWYRLLFVFILILLSIGTTTSLIILLYTDALKEKALAEKKKGWIDKWNMIKPYLKKFPLGFLLVLVIDRQLELS